MKSNLNLSKTGLQIDGKSLSSKPEYLQSIAVKVINNLKNILCILEIIRRVIGIIQEI